MSKLRTLTSHDVARHAGVSRATVSVVINGAKSNIRVSDETRRRVLASVAELGYSPHPVAQALRRQRSEIIGFVTRPDRGTPYDGPVPYFLSIELARAAMRRRYHVIETSAETNDARGSDELVQFLLSRRVDGVIFDFPTSADEVQRVIDRGLPTVQLMRPAFAAATDTVTVDARQGIETAVDYLVDHGHRRIAFIGHPGPHPVDRARLDLFAAALARRQLPLPDAYVRLGSGYSLAEGRSFTASLLALADRPTAIFLGADTLALGAMRALYEAGVRVPDGMSVISYDDAFAAHLYPPLTSVTQPFAEVANHAISLLTERLHRASDAASEPSHVVLATHLTIRDSVRRVEGG